MVDQLFLYCNNARITIVPCTPYSIVLKYPETIPGIFKEIEHFRVEPSTAPSTILLSAISLAGGACLGPEQALVSNLMMLVLVCLV